MIVVAQPHFVVSIKRWWFYRIQVFKIALQGFGTLEGLIKFTESLRLRVWGVVKLWKSRVSLGEYFFKVLESPLGLWKSLLPRVFEFSKWIIFLKKKQPSYLSNQKLFSFKINLLNIHNQKLSLFEIQPSYPSNQSFSLFEIQPYYLSNQSFSLSNSNLITLFSKKFMDRSNSVNFPF